MGLAEALIGSLNTLPVSAVVLDPPGNIVAVNETWKNFAKTNGLQLPNFAVGANYLRYCDSGDVAGKRLAENLRELCAGDGDLISLLYECHSATQRRWFFMFGMPLPFEGLAGTALFHVDLSKVIPVLSGIAAGNGRGAGTLSLSDAAGMVGGAMGSTISDALSSQLKALMSPVEAFPAQAGAPAGSERLDRFANLSKRQIEVFRLLGEGRTNAEIARELSRSPHTIKLHVSAILNRLNLQNRTQAALLASQLLRELLRE